MIIFRYLNVLAVLALIGSALYAYAVKYETMLFSAQITKLRHSIIREKEAIAVLRVEWAYLTRPERIQSLSDTLLDLKPLGLDQIMTWADLPNHPPPVDSIGQKIESFSLPSAPSSPSTAEKSKIPLDKEKSPSKPRNLQ